MVSAAENLIGHRCIWSYIPYDNLFAFHNHDATDCSGVMGCASTTPTQGFNLQSIYTVGKFNQSGRTRKKFGSKIGKDSKSENIYS
jgi:hypothetical protein